MVLRFALWMTLSWAICGCGKKFASMQVASFPSTSTGTSSSPIPVSSPSSSNTSSGPLARTSACQGGTSVANSSANVKGHGAVQFYNSNSAQAIVSLSTTLTVPSLPKPQGTVFLWPGLQPLGTSTQFNPINNGVLQPVLTWGPTCAPNKPANSYSSWWVSAQYVNTIGSQPGFTGCQGGEGMTVDPGDRLSMTISLAEDSSWNQVIIDETNGHQVSYNINLQGQSQNFAEFVIETYDGGIITPSVEFADTVIEFSSPPDSGCKVGQLGATDSVAGIFQSMDGKTCCYDQITLNQN